MSSRLLLVCLVFINSASDRVDALREPDREVTFDERIAMIMNHFSYASTHYNTINNVYTPLFIGKAVLDGLSLYALKPVVVPGGKSDEDKEIKHGVHRMTFDFKYNFLSVSVNRFRITVPNISKECREPHSTNNVNHTVHVTLLLQTTPICDLQLMRFRVQFLEDFKIPCALWGIYPSTNKRLAEKLKAAVIDYLEDGIEQKINFFNVVGMNPCDVLLPKS